MGTFVTLVPQKAYLKALESLAPDNEPGRGITQAELTLAEARADDWIRVGLGHLYDLTTWTTTDNTPPGVREAADLRASAIAHEWNWQKPIRVLPSAKEGGWSAKELFDRSRKAMERLQHVPQLYLLNGTKVQRNSNARQTVAGTRRRPAIAAEALQLDRQRYGVQEEQESALEDKDLYTE